MISNSLLAIFVLCICIMVVLRLFKGPKYITPESIIITVIVFLVFLMALLSGQ